MPRMPYSLVCHATRTKVAVGHGRHTFEVFDADLQALADFLADNVPYTFGLEIPHEDTRAYAEFIPPDGG